MSLPVFAWVLDHSEERLGNRLVLLALAEHAHDDGSKAFPANTTLMRRARLSERQVRNCLRKLEENGAIEKTGLSPLGTVVYRVIGPFNGGGQYLPGGQNRTARGAKSGSDFAPEPLKNRQKNLSSSKASIGDVDGKPMTEQEAISAGQAVDHFNEVFGKAFQAREHFVGAVMRLREGRTVDELVLAVDKTKAGPKWWNGSITPRVIWGSAVALDAALNADAGPVEDAVLSKYDHLG